jgi:hypothetical protein
MRSYLYIITSLLILLVTANTYSQGSFEGKVGYKINSDGETTAMDYYIKDNFIKMDVGEASEGASMIFDTKESKMIVIMDEQQMYMEMPVNINQELKSKEEKLKGEFKQTGETKDILGYKCEQWIYKDEENEIESWMTTELGSFVFMANPMSGGTDKPEWQTKLEQGGYFPLSVTVRESIDTPATTMEVTSIEKKSLDKSMFIPPADYQKLEMPGMK